MLLRRCKPRLRCSRCRVAGEIPAELMVKVLLISLEEEEEKKLMKVDES